MSTVPDIDYGSAEYKIPGDTNSGLYNVLSPISVEQFTEKVIDGTGVFDVLMSSIAVQMKNEFDNNRITGSEYTKAYIAGIEVAMGTALQFLLGKDAAYWQAVKSQAEAITAKLALQTGKYQTEAAKQQIEVTTQQMELTAQQIEVTTQQIELLKEQTETQRAQTLETRTDGNPVAGVVGSQKGLYNQQVDSYKRDAENKTAKLFTDAWTVQKTMDEGLLPPTNFTNTSLDALLTKIKLANGLA